MRCRGGRYRPHAGKLAIARGIIDFAEHGEIAARKRRSCPDGTERRHLARELEHAWAPRWDARWQAARMTWRTAPAPAPQPVSDARMSGCRHARGNRMRLGKPGHHHLPARARIRREAGRDGRPAAARARALRPCRHPREELYRRAFRLLWRRVRGVRRGRGHHLDERGHEPTNAAAP